MWEIFFLRPDALTALENENIKNILPRYIKLVNNEAIVNFQIIKRIEFRPKKQTLDQLWKEHDKLLIKYKNLKKDLDVKKIKFENVKKPKKSLLDLKILLTREIMKSCELCERKCKVNRMEGKKGICGVGGECSISSEFIHTGEEPHITPSHTIFFMGCTFKCQYCQNYSISQWFELGYKITSKEMAKSIERRRIEGARNVNFVGGEPTPNLLWILEALNFCEINTPVLWNSNMYMSEKTMKILEGIVDMYLSDFKYGNDECAKRLSKVPNFFEVCSRNHLLASKQAEITLRHLILPNHVMCCTKPVLEWISKNIKEKCIVNLMDQYYPSYKANEYEDINRRITKEEFKKSVDMANKLNLNFIT